MPRWTTHTDQVRQVIEQMARDEKQRYIQKLGPATAKATRFAFGRRVN